MFTSSSIIQWNLQSYNTKFEELKILLKQHIPACICLQETLIKRRIYYSPSKYNIEISNPVLQDGHERGSAILVHNQITYNRIPLNTTLQAVAIRMFTDKAYTVCSFIPATFTCTKM